jgi:signal transduction histidine kinase
MATEARRRPAPEGAADRDALAELVEAMSARRSSALRDAVERAGDELRSGSLGGDAVAQVGARLVALVRHPQWEVRKEVAHAVQYLRHETFHVAAAALLDDENAWVRGAAQRSLARRTELARTDVLQEQHGDLLLQWLSDLEAKHGARARQDALRVAEKYANLLIREARHEINRVISPIDLALHNIQTSLATARLEPQAKQVARARELVRHLSAIVDSLRELTSEITPAFRTEGLRAILEETVQLVRAEMKARGRQVTIEVNASRGLPVEANRDHLLQAFANILRNAVESYEGMPRRRERPRVRIVARADGDRHAVVEIIDRGCGMSEEALRDSVQLYSTSKQGGTGFGLPIAKRYIETEHGGTLRLASKKGVGTTVTVALPIVQDEAPE